MNSPLPERYQRYAAPAGQRPTYPATIELYDEHDPVVYVPNAYGDMVPMRKSQAPAPVQPVAPRDLTPQPLFDPLAQRMAGAGVGAGAAGAGAGWGFGQAAAGIATISGSTAVIVMLALYLAAKFLGGGGTERIQIRNEVHNHNSWWGHSSTEL